METAVYEQCPWERGHVTSLYRNIPDPVEDGEWHSVPVPRGMGWYRVFEERIFQAVFAPRPHRLAASLRAIAPPESEEDSGWFVTHEGETYGLTSVFARLPEWSPYWPETQRSLAPFGLGYRWDPSGFPRGWAWFAEPATGDLGFAMERLLFLEAAGREVHKLSPDEAWLHWKRYLHALDEAVPRDGYDETELLQLPASLPRSGPKRRVATAVDLETLIS